MIVEVNFQTIINTALFCVVTLLLTYTTGALSANLKTSEIYVYENSSATFVLEFPTDGVWMFKELSKGRTESPTSHIFGPYIAKSQTNA